jgi:hypothetical protein
MTRKFKGLLTLVLVAPLSLAAQDAKTVLQAASKAMGDVRSIQYSGTGMAAKQYYELYAHD